MSHTYSQNHIHVVFSTKERQKLIDQQTQPKLWAYMAGIARNHDFLVLANGGVEDHVHLLIQLPPVLALAEAVSFLKSNSSRWMSDKGIDFAWQEGYGAFSVSASNLAAVEKYIHNQATIIKKLPLRRSLLLCSKSTELTLIPNTFSVDVPRLRRSDDLFRLPRPSGLG